MSDDFLCNRNKEKNCIKQLFTHTFKWRVEGQNSFYLVIIYYFVVICCLFIVNLLQNAHDQYIRSDISSIPGEEPKPTKKSF